MVSAINPRRAITALFLGSAWAAAQTPGGPSPPPAGAISGLVLDERGAPVNGATVLIRKIPDVERQGRRLLVHGPGSSIRAVSNQSGVFRAPGLLDGFYTLCAYGPQRHHLMTCDWGEPYRHSTVKSNEETRGVQMTIASGVVLRFRISDPAAHFGSSQADRIGVRSSKGVFKRATLVTRANGVAEFAITVPRRSAFLLYSFSSTGLSDSAGNIPDGLSRPISTGEEAEQVILLSAR